jgi:hypothetical protein
MVRIGLQLTAILIFVFAISIGDCEADGAQSRVRALKVPPGAKVVVRGSSATITMPAARSRAGGTWNCACAITPGEPTGSCTLKETRNLLSCTKEPGDTCKTACAFVKQPTPP